MPQPLGIREVYKVGMIEDCAPNVESFRRILTNAFGNYLPQEGPEETEKSSNFRRLQRRDDSEDLEESEEE